MLYTNQFKKNILLVLVFFFSFTLLAQKADLIILHSNDMHGRIEVADGIMGMPYITSIIADYRAKYDNVLVLDAGDTIHGRPITDQLKGESVVAAMNYAGYDVMVPGNHEFNFGYERLLELEQSMEFDLIASNIYKDSELFFNPYVIKEVGNFRIGIFGIATAATLTTTHPNNIIGIEFASMVEAAEKYVKILQEEKVDFIIALGHCGLAGAYTSKSVIDEVDGIDLFVDGHSHDLLLDGLLHHNTLIVQTNEHAKYFGVVEVFFQASKIEMKASLISAAEAKEKYEADQNVEDMIQDFRAEVRKRILGL